MTRLDDEEPDAPDQPDVPEPMGPDTKEPSDNRTLSSPINELESRLLKQRKVLVFGAINDKVARDVTGRLLALASEGEAADRRVYQFARRPCGERRHHPRHDPLRGRGGAGAGDRDGLGGERRGADLTSRAARSTGCACRTRASCCTSRWAACAARRPTSTSRRARSSRCASGSTTSSPAKPARASRRISTDTDRNYWMSAEEAIAYGLVSRVVQSAKEF